RRVVKVSAGKKRRVTPTLGNPTRRVVRITRYKFYCIRRVDMAYDAIVYEKVEEKIFRITLNRPEKLNAMSRQLLSELDSALDEFENNNEASVLIIRGAGRAFCAGYDLQPVSGSGGFTVTSDRLGLRKIVQRWARLWNFPKTTNGQGHGYCISRA